MPIIKSAKKAHRASLRKGVFNDRRKRTMRDKMKEIKNLVDENKIKEANALLPEVYKAVDKACKRGVIKKNTASRKKSRLTALINKKTTGK